MPSAQCAQCSLSDDVSSFSARISTSEPMVYSSLARENVSLIAERDDKEDDKVDDDEDDWCCKSGRRGKDAAMLDDEMPEFRIPGECCG